MMVLKMALVVCHPGKENEKVRSQNSVFSSVGLRITLSAELRNHRTHKTQAEYPCFFVCEDAEFRVLFPGCLLLALAALQVIPRLHRALMLTQFKWQCPWVPPSSCGPALVWTAVLAGCGSLHHWCSSPAVQAPEMVLGLRHVLGVLCSCPVCNSFGKTCFFFWENYGKDFERLLTLCFCGYHKVTPNPAAVGPALHRCPQEQDLAWAYLGRKKVSSR